MRKRIQPVVILLFLQVFGNRLDGAGQGASDIGQGHGEGADRFAGKLLRGIGHMEKAAAQAGIFERRRIQQRIQKAVAHVCTSGIGYRSGQTVALYPGCNCLDGQRGKNAAGPSGTTGVSIG